MFAWLKSTPQFMLKVYNPIIWKYLEEDSPESLIYAQGRFPKLKSLLLGDVFAESLIKQMIVRNYISKSWLDFYEWWDSNLSKRLVFCGIDCWNFAEFKISWKNLVKTGNDRKGWRAAQRYIGGDLKSEDTIWAINDFRVAWEK